MGELYAYGGEVKSIFQLISESHRWNYPYQHHDIATQDISINQI